QYNFDAIAAAIKDPEPLTRVLPPNLSRESVVPIIDSLMNDKEGIYQVNVLNKGVIEDLPDNVAVEIPARVDEKGVHRMRVEKLPKRIVNYVLRPRMMRMEWALEAFLEGGRDALFEWLIIDPRTKSTEQVNQVIDEILSMPENLEMARHFR
ncbi:MAG: alpha-glucosidase/alpha-galactosidase, partial [Thermoproteota archaeon]